MTVLSTTTGVPLSKLLLPAGPTFSHLCNDGAQTKGWPRQPPSSTTIQKCLQNWENRHSLCHHFCFPSWFFSCLDLEPTGMRGPTSLFLVKPSTYPMLNPFRCNAYALVENRTSLSQSPYYCVSTRQCPWFSVLTHTLWAPIPRAPVCHCEKHPPPIGSTGQRRSPWCLGTVMPKTIKSHVSVKFMAEGKTTLHRTLTYC